MEWKIGEIRQVNGEWYQCLRSPEKGISCDFCSLFRPYFVCPDCFPSEREDNTKVIFKKLEKVGEPFTIIGKLYQHYKVFDIDNVCGDGFWCIHNYKAKTLTIEIKENKEDMEKKDKEIQLNNLLNEYLNDLIDDKELEKGIKEWFAKHSNSEKIGKNFDLEAAKAGKPVCTRDGRKARIICFDAKGNQPIVALFERENSDEEIVQTYFKNGSYYNLGHEDNRDLMMLSEEKEGWVNIYKDSPIYATKEEAQKCANKSRKYITTIKIEYEE